MPLTPESALNKDKRTALAPLQHRHFATIAAILRDMPWDLFEHQPESLDELVAKYFADRLVETNPNFNRERFLAACEAD